MNKMNLDKQVTKKKGNKKERPLVTPELAQLLLETRQQRGYSLKQASYKTGISHTTLSHLERGLVSAPYPEDLRKIAKGMRINYNHLMRMAGYIDEEQTPTTDPNGVLMFSDQESFNAMPEEEREHIIKSLREQADFMIERYKRNK